LKLRSHRRRVDVAGLEAGAERGVEGMARELRHWEAWGKREGYTTGTALRVRTEWREERAEGQAEGQAEGGMAPKAITRKRGFTLTNCQQKRSKAKVPLGRGGFAALRRPLGSLF
jgi:hypothetical protein